MGISHPQLIGVKQIDLSDDTSVAALASLNNTLTPPAGQFYKVRFIQISLPDPAGSSNGSHSLTCGYSTTGAAPERFFYLVSGFGNTITTNCCSFVASTTENPSNAREQFILLSGVSNILVTPDNPLIFRYTNATDVAQDQTREIKVMVEVYQNGF